MNQTPFVSIAIPFYNAECFLQQAIQSVINQSYASWELLLLDDGSTDSSLEIAKRFSDARIKVISDGVNRGLVYRLNQSIHLAQGEYYARMDADDIMHPERLERQIQEMVAHPEIDILGTSCYSIDADNSIKYYNCLPAIPCIKDLRIIHPSVVAKRSWFINHLYDSNYVRIEDTELWLRVLGTANIRNLSDPLLFYREYGIPTFKKYIKSQMGALRLAIKHPFYRKNRILRFRYIILTLIKIVLCCSLASIGKMDLLISLRKKSKCSFDECLAKLNLAKALEQKNINYYRFRS